MSFSSRLASVSSKHAQLLAGITVAVALAMLASGVAATPARADGTVVDGASAIAFLNQQRAATGIPAVTLNQAFVTAWCPAEDTGPWSGESFRDLSPSDTWAADVSPWDAAPLHQFSMYNPLFTAAGDLNVFNQPWDGVDAATPSQACMGLGDAASEPATPTFYDFVGDVGASAVPPSETVQGEGPFAPQEVVGIPEGTPTGPDLLLYALGFPPATYGCSGTCNVEPLSWSLTTAAGVAVPGVQMVDDTNTTAYGYPGYISDGGIMIPPVLATDTVYNASVVWQGPKATPATQTFSFTTTFLDAQLEGMFYSNELWASTYSPMPITVTVTSLPSSAVVAQHVLTGTAGSYVPYDPSLPTGTYQACFSQAQGDNYAAAADCVQGSLIAPPAPTNTSLPEINGRATQGSALHESNGTWTNSPTGYSYQWERCNAAGNACKAVAGATAQNYTLPAADDGSTIRVQEIASNGGGSGMAALSAATTVIPGPPPAVRIVSGPAAFTASTTATVTWTTTGSVTATKCYFDNKAIFCSGHSVTLKGLNAGKHQLAIRVKGNDGAANVDKTWTVTKPGTGHKPSALAWSKLHFTSKNITSCAAGQRACKPKSAALSFDLTTSARVTVTLTQKVSGKAHAVAHIAVTETAGSHIVTIGRNFGGHKLAAGTYQLTAQAVSGKSRTSTFHAIITVR